MSETPTTNSNVYQLGNPSSMTAAEYLQHYTESIEHDHIIEQRRREIADNIDLFAEDSPINILNEALPASEADPVTETKMTRLQELHLAVMGMETPQHAEYLGSIGRNTVHFRTQYQHERRAA